MKRDGIQKMRKFLPILFLFACLGCNQANPRLLPTQLVGFWTADDSRYQGRFLELYTAFVIIGTGPHDNPQVQMVDRVKTEQLGTETSYTITSTDLSGSHYEMELRFDPARGGEIRFANSRATWTRRNPDAAKGAGLSR
jgi:hypothetical protein